MNSKIIRRLAN